MEQRWAGVISHWNHSRHSQVSWHWRHFAYWQDPWHSWTGAMLPLLSDEHDIICKLVISCFRCCYWSFLNKNSSWSTGFSSLCLIFVIVSRIPMFTSDCCSILHRFVTVSVLLFVVVERHREVDSHCIAAVWNSSHTHWYWICCFFSKNFISLTEKDFDVVRSSRKYRSDEMNYDAVWIVLIVNNNYCCWCFVNKLVIFKHVYNKWKLFFSFYWCT